MGKCPLKFDDEDKEVHCAFYYKWNIPCRHLFIAALRRGEKNLIDSKMFVERFKLNQMDAYEQHVLQKGSEVSMDKIITEGEGVMTTTVKINSHIFEIESLCISFVCRRQKTYW